MLIDTREVEGFTIKTYAEEEHIAIRGNVMASGDAKEDKKVEDRLIRGLEAGKLQYWFCAKVVAEKAGVELATEYLGCCSYNSFKQFLESGDYHSDMVRSAVKVAKDKLKELKQQEIL